MQPSNKIAENLEKLADIRRKNPTASHIYIRRTTKDNLVVDIPIAQIEFIIRNNPLWEVVASNKQMDDAVEALFKDEAPAADPVAAPILEQVLDQELELEVPPKPSEIKPKRKYTRKKK